MLCYLSMENKCYKTFHLIIISIEFIWHLVLYLWLNILFLKRNIHIYKRMEININIFFNIKNPLVKQKILNIFPVFKDCYLKQKPYNWILNKTLKLILNIVNIIIYFFFFSFNRKYLLFQISTFICIIILYEFNLNKYKYKSVCIKTQNYVV